MLWTAVELGQIAQLINGDRGQNYPSQLHRVASGIPFINAGHLNGGLVRTERMDYISQERFNLLRNGRVEENDLLLCIRGTLGRVAIATNSIVPAAIASSLVIIRPGPDVVPRYLLAFLQSPPGQQQILSCDNGAAQPNVGAGDVARFLAPLPPLGTQRKIAAILSAYDALIENNTRRIKILEEMAQGIFREWFIEFRYPGHDSAEMVDPQIGSVPEGWDVVPASDAMEINPSMRFDRSAARPFVPMTSLSETVMHFEPVETRITSSGARFQNGDTLFARITPCLENGKTAFTQGLGQGVVASGSTEFIVMRGRRVSPQYTYLLARSGPFRDHAIKSMSGATGRQRVREDSFDIFLLALPPRELMQRFTDGVEPMFMLSARLFQQVRKLRAARDLLLPRLISGEIDVENLDIAIEDAAA